MDRRDFLKTAGAAAAGYAALDAATARGAAEKPNERVRLAMMGVRGRGVGLTGNFLSRPDAEIVALCDIDDASFAKAHKLVNDKAGKAPRTEKDIRKVLEDKTIDAIVCSAPNHWHAPATVWACQAGKDVYVEKPVSHNIIEGRWMVQAARKHNRVVQAGTQRRSGAQFKRAVEFLQSGKLGKPMLARTWIIHKRANIGKKPDGEVPAGVDYDLWLGPASKRPFNPNHFHYNWHWFWEYGNGELGNNGIHGLDVARWGLGVDDPVHISSAGGKYFFTDDDQETPDTQIVHYDFAGCTLQWEHRTWYTAAKKTTGTRAFGIAWHCEKGTLQWDGDWKVLDSDVTFDPGPSENVETAHAANFLECIKSRNRSNADIEIGHLSTRLCHLGNIAHRLRKTLTFDAKTETIPGDSEANALLGRTYRKGFEIVV